MAGDGTSGAVTHGLRASARKQIPHADQTLGPEEQDRGQHGAQYDLVAVAADREEVLLHDDQCRADNEGDTESLAEFQTYGEFCFQQALLRVGLSIAVDLRRIANALERKP